jgi:hypothetical protein
MNYRFPSFLAQCLPLLAVLIFGPPDAPAQWVNGQSAQFVLGQSNFGSTNTGVSGTLLGSLGTHAFAIDYVHGKLYMSDPINFRVLRFAYPITQNGPSAELAFGQTNLTSNVPPLTTTANTLNRSWGVAVLNGDLWVVDRADGRILRYSHAWSDASNGPAADLVLGAPDFTTVAPGTSQSQMLQPRGMCFDPQGNLWVADGNNNRVLEFVNANSKTNGAAADKVLGQPDFSSSAIPVPPTGASMETPYGVCFSGSTLWVADGNNNRVLRFANAGSKSNGGAADGVLGQPDFGSSSGDPNPTAATLHTPTAPIVDGNGTLYLCDYSNNRVLIYRNASSKANGANADNVLGQPDFTSNPTVAPPVASSLALPNGIEVDDANGKLLVADERDIRVLQYSASAAPLPIQLASFAALLSNDGVRLTWKTVSEVDNYGFEIQRSPDGVIKEWVKVGFVSGNGTSSAAHAYAFLDRIDNVMNVYRLKQIDLDGTFHFSEPVGVGTVAGIEARQPMPGMVALEQNYPNPFNPATTIRYGLPLRSVVSLAVFNTLGQLVATLVQGEQDAGYHEVKFEASHLASGVYFYRLQAGDLAHTRKLLIAK